MNKFTYATFSVLMGILFFLVVFFNGTAKLIAGIFALTFLLFTMIKLIMVVSYREATGNYRTAVVQ